ncbi:MAG TPA: DUF4199 domain-containing protein [Flavisolibacter sp.]|nr:DUF4199 domain-containing protein [Flavisolibacter sp.]
MEQKPISHVTAGLIIGAVLVLLSILSSYAESAGRASQWLVYLVIFGGLIFFITRYGKSRNNNVTFGNLFAYGFKTTAVFILLMIGFIVLFNLIFPEFKEKGFEMARAEMEKNKSLKEEDIDRAMGWARDYFWVFAIGGTALLYTILGAIGSLIGAAVTKKQPRNPVDQLDL